MVSSVYQEVNYTTSLITLSCTAFPSECLGRLAAIKSLKERNLQDDLKKDSCDLLHFVK